MSCACCCAAAHALSRVLPCSHSTHSRPCPSPLHVTVLQRGGDDIESLDFEQRHKPWFKKKRFWRIAAPLLVSFALLLAGILYLVYNPSGSLAHFQVWRLLIFLAG